MAVDKTFLRSTPFDLPGVTASWLAEAHGCSLATVRRRRQRAAFGCPSSREFLAGMSAEKGLAMALARRPRGVLPLWSRMAIAEYAALGLSYSDLMRMFGIGRSTVYRALHHESTMFCPLSGGRKLTPSQKKSPPNEELRSRIERG